MSATPRYREVQRVLVLTLVANLLVAASKIVVGLLTGTLSMVADGVHSSLDATNNVVGLVSVHFAARPPDAEHPYGHRRYETLASLLIGGLLLVTAWEIVKSSLERLTGADEPEVGALNFAVMIVTVGVNLAISVYESREGKRLRSEFLLADSAHTRSDIFVSLTVIAGLVAVRLGWAWVDAVAALGVVAIIALAAWRILRRAADILVDSAALDPDEVAAVVGETPGVQEVVRVRSRGPGDDVHVDLDVRVAAPTTADHAAAIADAIRARLRERFDGLRDIVVYFAPDEDGATDHALVARAEADALGLSAHEVIATKTPTGVVLELHVEVDPDQTVAEAHALASAFEAAMQRAIPSLERIVTHIEPAHAGDEAHIRGVGAHALVREARKVAERLYPDGEWHDFDIRLEADGGYALSMHCRVQGDMPLEEAHRMTEVVETGVSAVLPALHRVTIHTEPGRAERRSKAG
mgnify:CR=1 FL=1